MAEVSLPMRLANIDVLIVAEGGEVVLRGFGAREIELSVVEARCRSQKPHPSQKPWFFQPRLGSVAGMHAIVLLPLLSALRDSFRGRAVLQLYRIRFPGHKFVSCGGPE